jgi:hypothetical protein
MAALLSMATVLMLSAAPSILPSAFEAISSQPRQAPTNAQASLVDLPATPAEALRYTVSMMGNKAGANIVWRTPTTSSDRSQPVSLPTWSLWTAIR